MRTWPCHVADATAQRLCACLSTLELFYHGSYTPHLGYPGPGSACSGIGRASSPRLELLVRRVARKFNWPRRCAPFAPTPTLLRRIKSHTPPLRTLARRCQSPTCGDASPLRASAPIALLAAGIPDSLRSGVVAT